MFVSGQTAAIELHVVTGLKNISADAYFNMYVFLEMDVISAHCTKVDYFHPLLYLFR